MYFRQRIRAYMMDDMAIYVYHCEYLGMISHVEITSI